jgi:hypothetical protein
MTIARFSAGARHATRPEPTSSEPDAVDHGDDAWFAGVHGTGFELVGSVGRGGVHAKSKWTRLGKNRE